jgi:aryl sulfotransferase
MYAAHAAQTHRRFMKTHTPADGIPWFDDARYVVVVRDGRDAYMSWVNHVQRIRGELKAGLSTRAKDAGLPEFPDWDGDIHRFFQAWLDGAAHMHHVASFWRHRHQSNVLRVHYNDLKADLAGEMRRIARFLDIEVPADAWPAVVGRCTFEAMQADGDRIGDFEALFDGGAKSFIFKGTNGRWRGVLSETDLAAQGDRVAELLPPDAAAWMEFGRAHLGAVANP